ncbi:MAG TPA: hypothetical protein DCZ11_08840 [Gammaproteobacteria bacterium]|nr:hypothetical protein [Gammaproteobacteria bacterium]MCH78535.1 hypothetical protein [Gammaproteobacteria bacterium]
MTVIAWDGKTLAADKRTCSGTLIGVTTKIRRLRGHLCGVTGQLDFGEQMFAWFDAGADPEGFPQSQRDKDDWAGLVAIDLSGRILRYERTPYPLVVEQQKAAWGSGRDFALCAMVRFGVSAREAVEIASMFDCGCGNGVDELTLA